MKTTSFINKTGPLLLILLLVSVVGCNNLDTFADFSAEDSDDVITETFDDASSDDAEDLALTALSDELLSGGKLASVDDRFQCAVVTRTGDKNAGTIRIDFGDGCADPRGRIRKGAIVIVYNGVWSVPGSNWTITLEDYFIDNVNLFGTRNVQNITTDTLRRRFQIDMEDGSATWPDGRVARRRVHRIREHERNLSNVLIRLIIYGTAEGNHRNGRGYYIEILEPLVYDRECRAQGVIIPVKGKKLIRHGDRQITVDYGDGRCDNIVTLINVNGRTKDVRIGG